MCIESAIRTLAGSLVLVSIALAVLWSPYALILAAFVGANLIQSSFTGFCPAERMLRRVGLRSAASASEGTPS